MSEREEKRAPVQGYSAGIPWSMHLRAYDAYSKKWAPQPAMIDLEGRNCRGGFSTGELDEFIPGWRDELSELTRLRARMAELEGALRPFAEAGGSASAQCNDYAGAFCKLNLNHLRTARAVLQSVAEPGRAEPAPEQRSPAMVMIPRSVFERLIPLLKDRPPKSGLPQMDVKEFIRKLDAGYSIEEAHQAGVEKAAVDLAGESPGPSTLAVGVGGDQPKDHPESRLDSPSSRRGEPGPAIEGE